MDKSQLIFHYFKTPMARFLFFISFTLFIITSLLFGWYWYQRSTLTSRVAKSLFTIAKRKEKEILNLIAQDKKFIRQISENKSFIESAHALNETFVPGKLGDFKTLPDNYKNHEKELDQFLASYPHLQNYKDLFLISSQGTIFYVYKGEMISADLLQKNVQNSALTASFSRVMLTLTPDISEFSMDTLTNEPSLFILQPLFVEDKFFAVVALQVDETNFYNTLHDTQRFGANLDILLTKKMDARALYISPSRLISGIAFKKISNSDLGMETPAYRASVGQAGTEVSHDITEKKAITAWTFIPQVNWGLVVTLGFAQAGNFLFWWGWATLLSLFLLLIFSGWLFYYLINIPKIHRIKEKIFSPRMVFLFFLFSFLLSLLISISLVWNRYQNYTQIFSQMKELAQSKVQSQADILQQKVTVIEKTLAMIALDLKKLEVQSLKIRTERDIKEVPLFFDITIAFAPFAVDPNKRLFGIQTKKEKGIIQTSEVTYDYMIPGSQNETNTDWFNTTLQEGAGWSNTFVDPNYGPAIRYSMPVYTPNKEPLAVISAVVTVPELVEGIRSIEIGKNGYGILLSAKGSFIYHPNAHYLENNITVGDIAQSQNNQTLKDLLTQIENTTKGFGSYEDKATDQEFWMAYAKVTSSNWIVAGVFSQDALGLPYQAMHKQLIMIFVSIIITCLLLLMLLTHLEQFTLLHAKHFSILSSAIFVAAIIIFLAIIRNTPYIPPDNRQIIHDQTTLDNYIDLLQMSSTQKNEKPPITIPTGIIIHTLSFDNTDKISISGYMWQKIKKEQKVTAGVRFPNAQTITLDEIFKKDEKDHHIIAWKMNAEFLQKYRFSWFPFDRVHVDITMASNDFENNVVIVPDLSGYTTAEFDPFPGIINQIAVPGFDIEKTFFSFSTMAATDEKGIEETIKNVTEKSRLHYNVILERKLTNPFIIFFFPLLIILFSIYTVFLITFRTKILTSDVFTTLSSYTAVFFTLVVLHQTLRTQYPASEFLYIEFFFFFSYVTIFFLTLHSLILRLSPSAPFVQRFITPYLRLLFWPIQLACWFIITMLVFYKMR